MSIEGRLVIESSSEGINDIDDWKDIDRFRVFFGGIFVFKKFNNLLRFLFFLAGLLYFLFIFGQRRPGRA